MLLNLWGKNSLCNYKCGFHYYESGWVWVVCEQQRTKETEEERNEQSAVEGMGIGSLNRRDLVIHKNTKN